ncbi:hypothetical protein B0T17DRAFT_72729 [Bombardia bombarda]|uniref:Uncharacterized protein n=1 Tax=Bombardia bombarda TaxID=252184 RepID=A0AA40CF53_9PEZI|nr:hypothetical protein B0T17DRAFT_72729 [Bombardia bombarda]
MWRYKQNKASHYIRSGVFQLVLVLGLGLVASGSSCPYRGVDGKCQCHGPQEGLASPALLWFASLPMTLLPSGKHDIQT